MPLIEISNLNKFMGEGENRLHILKDINLVIQQGEFIAIVGQSGSGKSTLMNMLGCLDTPTSGSYTVDGVETLEMDPDQLAALRSHKFGFIFQRYNLLGSLSAVENVALPAVYAGISGEARLARAAELLGKLGLENKLKSRPNELSGGQQQRISIARALMNGGEVILADEPTGALDSRSGEVLMDILKELNSQGHTIILVTHDHNIAAYAERVIEIRDGEVVAERLKETQASKAMLKAPASEPANTMAYYKDQLIESFRMSVQAIGAHKLRSMLTMLGIIIGIASVVSVVALGRGSQAKILSDISSMGTNTIDIYPGESFGDRQAWRVKTLTVDDAEVLARQSYLASATPNTSATGVLVYRNVSVNAQISGVGEQYFNVKGLLPETGRLLTARDISNNASVVVIDQNTKKALFPNGENPLGKIIIFSKQPLEIIGVTQKKDSVFGPSDNLNLWAPYTTVMNKISGERNISSIIAKVRDDVSSQVAEKNLTHLLTVKHGGKKDFFTMNTDSIKKTIESTTGTMTLLVSCIALISLVVGGIGVMNIMLVSVTERTSEIGVRMAIGARRHNILAQFLIEAILICLIGGFFGIVVSLLIGVAFDMFVKGFAMSYSTGAIVLALGCSTLIGVVFGFMPARNASRLNPIDALARD